MRRGAVLILGNGISRLSFAEEIERWEGELWACNYAFREFGPRLDRLTGHHSVMAEAKKERDEREWTFKIWGGNLAQKEYDERFTCPGEFLKDSGTTLVAQALHEGRKQVELCGFDLGGPDILSPGLERQHKVCWVLRWRLIARVFGLDAVNFWGYNHKPFIMSEDLPADAYQRLYLSGKPHLNDKRYLEEYAIWTGKPVQDVVRYGHEKVLAVVKSSGERVEFRRDIAEIYQSKGLVKILEGAR